MNDDTIMLFLFLTLGCIMRITETYDVDDDQNIYNYTYNKPLAMGITFVGSIFLYNSFINIDFDELKSSSSFDLPENMTGLSQSDANLGLECLKNLLLCKKGVVFFLTVSM